MLTYNYNAAIQMRGKTLDDLGYYDVQTMHPNTATEIVNFKLSLQITSNAPGQDYDWGNMPPHAEVLVTIGKTGDWKYTSKEAWKTMYSAYRKYCTQATEDHNANYKNFAL